MKTNTVFFLLLTIVISSCASIQVPNMISDDQNLVFEPTGKKVKVTTTHDFRTKIYKAEEFNEALEKSLEHSGLFIVDSDNYDYELHATMTHWFQPPVSLTFHSDLRVLYDLTHKNDSLYKKELESNSVATMKDAFVGAKRSIISLERAAKQNIEMFIKEISEINFD